MSAEAAAPLQECRSAPSAPLEEHFQQLVSIRSAHFSFSSRLK